MVPGVKLAVPAAAVILGLAGRPLQAQSTDEINATLQFNFSNPGARSLGLAGAFTARADDATAVYANPAGLLQLSKPELSIELRGWEYSNVFLQGGSLDESLRLGDSPAETEGLSFLSAFYPSRSGHWGIGVYRHESARFEAAVRTQGARLERGAFVRPLDGFYRLEIENLGISFAYGLPGRLTLGGTLTQARVGLESRTERLRILRADVGRLDPVRPAPGFSSPFGNEGEHLFAYETQTSDGGDERDLVGTLGLLWQSRRTRGGAPVFALGAVYRQGPEFGFIGNGLQRRPNEELTLNLFVPIAALGAVGPECRPTGCPATFKVPDVAGIGFSVRPTPNWVLALDLDRIEYSDLTDRILNITGGEGTLLPGESGPPRDYSIDDGLEIRLGGEYALLRDKLPDLFLRAGAWLDPNHRIDYSGPSASLSALWVEGEDEVHLAGGVGIRYPRFQIDAAIDLSDRVDTISLSGVYYFGRSPRVLDKEYRRRPPRRRRGGDPSRTLEREGIADYQRLYVLGRRAMDRGFWDEAVILLARAIEEEGERPVRIIRPYGTFAESYLPEYYLGICLYALEEYAEALDAWDEAERRANIGLGRNRGQRRYVERLERELPDLLMDARARLEDRIRRRAERLAALEPLLGQRAGADPRLDRAKESFTDAANALTAVERPGTEEETAAVARLLRESKRRYQAGVALADKLAAEVRSLSADARVDRELARRKERRESYEGAVRSIREGDCAAAIRALAPLAHGDRGPIDSSEGLAPHRELARAYASCGDLGRAALYLELARRRTRAENEELLPVVEAVEKLVFERLAERAGAAAGECRPESVVELTELTGLVADSDVPATASAGNSTAGVVAAWLERASDACGFERPGPGTSSRIRASVAEIEPGDCSAGAVALLEAATRIEATREWLAEKLPSVIAALAGGYLHCGRPDEASRVASAHSAPNDDLTALRGRIENAIADLESERMVEGALTKYLEARFRIESGQCGKDVGKLLDDSRRVLLNVAGPDSRIPGFELVYRPDLYKARERRNCRDPVGLQGAVDLARAGLEGRRQFGADEPLERELAALEHWLVRNRTGTRYAKSHALLIGASSYDKTPAWPPLDGPQDDVEWMRRTLRAQGFDPIEVLRDPSLKDLKDVEGVVSRFIGEWGRDEDSFLVIYYAGHGHPIERRGVATSYLVPVDADDPESPSQLVGVGSFVADFQEALSNQMLFVFDSCFAGSFVEKLVRDYDWEGQSAETLTARPSLFVLMAGGAEQKVPDFSVFRRNLIDGLSGEADLDDDGLVLGNELGRFSQQVVPELTKPKSIYPQFGVVLEGPVDQRPEPGDVAFEVASGEAMLEPFGVEVELELWEKVRSSDHADGYGAYEEAFASGAFTPVAERRRKRLQEQAPVDFGSGVRLLERLRRLSLEVARALSDPAPASSTLESPPRP